MSSNYNANLFALKTYQSFKVNVYSAKLEPFPAKSGHFYQVLGRLARRLTESIGTAVISHEGKIKVLESTLSANDIVSEIELENINKFKVTLLLESTQLVDFANDPQSYGGLVNRIVDLALCYLSKDYYKYGERSPYIIEHGEGYFDKALRQRIGVEDGRRFYRGFQTFFGKPYLLVNREIELRSWQNLLNELKILALWWQTKRKGEEFDFYNPPKEFISFVNWTFRNRTANVKAYPAPSIVIKEITWDARADSKVLEGNISPLEYHKSAQGIPIKDAKQPLVKWTMVDQNGMTKELFHIPEFLIVGHTFRDLKMRLLPSQISQIFDILHPHCGEQQRKIYEIMRKVDSILRNNFAVLYPSKFEFLMFPENINKEIETASPVTIKFGNKEIDITPPYGINFYRKYTARETFVQPLNGVKKLLIFCDDSQKQFVESLKQEIELRNGCTLECDYRQLSEVSIINPLNADLAITITNDGELIKSTKRRLVGEYGVPHQNVTPEKANIESIPQIAMQVTLKMGGYPWFISNTEQTKIVTVYAYRNPFNGMRCFLFNIFESYGQMLFQSKPYDTENFQLLLKDLESKLENEDKILLMMSFWDNLIEGQIAESLKKVKNYVFVKILQNNELQLFSTFKPSVNTAPRRRTNIVTYACEAYENAPQGVILNAGNGEYFILTTGSTKIGTYYRGCPTPIRVKVIQTNGYFEINKIIHTILALSFAAGISGHGTRLPAPLYYLKVYAKYINDYGLPSADIIFQRIFYV